MVAIIKKVIKYKIFRISNQKLIEDIDTETIHSKCRKRLKSLILLRICNWEGKLQQYLCKQIIYEKQSTKIHLLIYFK